MHVAFLTPEFPLSVSTHTGGLGTSTYHLAQELVKLDVTVTVFIYGEPTSYTKQIAGITIVGIQHQNYPFLGWYLHRKYIASVVSRYVTQHAIDLIEAPDWTGITAFMKFPCPLIIRLHGSDTYFCQIEKRKQKIKNYIFEKLALQKASAYIAPTKYAANLSAQLFKLDTKKIKTIPYGITLAHFTNSSPDSFVRYQLVYVGTLIRKKGIFELAKIFNELVVKVPEATLLLIGSDSADIQTGSKSTYELFCKELSQEALLQQTYIGNVPYEKVTDSIKNAHVCLFPSHAETFGLVTIESMAMEKPVVTFDYGWNLEIITHGVNGYSVPSTSISEFVASVYQLLSDEPLRVQIAKNGKESVAKRFDIQKIAIKNRDFYKTVLLP